MKTKTKAHNPMTQEDIKDMIQTIKIVRLRDYLEWCGFTEEEIEIIYDRQENGGFGDYYRMEPETLLNFTEDIDETFLERTADQLSFTKAIAISPKGILFEF